MPWKANAPITSMRLPSYFHDGVDWIVPKLEPMCRQENIERNGDLLNENKHFARKDRESVKDFIERYEALEEKVKDAGCLRWTAT